MMMKNKWLVVLLLGLVVGLSGCADDDDGDKGSSSSNYRSCKISQLTISAGLTLAQRNEILGQCWSLPGKGESSSSAALAWCKTTTEDYLNTDYPGNVTAYSYQVSKNKCN